jgi:hypothetical protein
MDLRTRKIDVFDVSTLNLFRVDDSTDPLSIAVLDVNEDIVTRNGYSAHSSSRATETFSSRRVRKYLNFILLNISNPSNPLDWNSSTLELNRKKQVILL